ncbi:hypothetical protein LC065_20025 (plasmid) [Halobacillus litoralis]|uniref:hypothetical protein n=1 Tax=Halobacillus litoralis TaxID=45668 RepID=UPI001CFEBDFB|nr:hypothetical protein [Halobacillus litoralis]WLR49596.1 hypothetical protein LC065_20025 [Halobacillus litoralis]
MAVGDWLLHGHNIGLPLEIGNSYQGEVGATRANGAKNGAYLKSVNATHFKVKLYKEHADQEEQWRFRQQLEQLQNGIDFMPYYLLTNNYAQEFHEHLVIVESINIDRKAGIILHDEYDINFTDLGHIDEFRGYTLYNPQTLPTNQTEVDPYIDIAYPPNTKFHSDAPYNVEGLPTEWGKMQYVTDPSTRALSYEGGLDDVSRTGIEVIQDGVQLYSTYERVGKGLSISNGYFKMVWDGGQISEPTMGYWDESLGDYSFIEHERPPKVFWGVIDPDSGETSVYYEQDAVDEKIEIKRLTTEYAQVDQKYLFGDGVICVARYHLNRGKNDVRIQARGWNVDLDWFYLRFYLKDEYIDTYTLNQSTQSVTDDEVTVEDLTHPDFFVTLPSGKKFGYTALDDIGEGKVYDNSAGGYTYFQLRHSWNTPSKAWSVPLQFYQGTNSPGAKRNQAGYLIRAGTQVVHRSYVY